MPLTCPGPAPSQFSRAPTAGLRKQALRLPQESRKRAEILGSGVDAVLARVSLLDELGVLP
jgi:hypothetical protein